MGASLLLGGELAEDDVVLLLGHLVLGTVRARARVRVRVRVRVRARASVRVRVRVRASGPGWSRP